MGLFWRILGLFIVVVSAVSCNKYSLLLKGSDHKLKFQKAIEYYDAGKYAKTVALMAGIAKIYEGKSGEDTVAYYLGAAFYKDGDFYNSSEIFDMFRRTYQYSPFLEEVEYMYARGRYFMSPATQRDQAPTMEALIAINEYLQRYPNSVKKEALEENLVELQNKLYDKSFESARLYYKIGYFNSAIFALRNALEAYPDTPHREEIMYYITRSSYEYAKNSVETMQRERYMNLQDAYYSFISDYPDSKYREEVDAMQEEAREHLAKYVNNSNTENGNQEEQRPD